MFAVFLAMSIVSAVQPFGASFNVIGSQKAPADAPQSHAAIAGNVTQIVVTGYSTTSAWQGYYGNVSGTIQLADGSDKVMYNWSLANPQGEIYASTSNSVSWSNIQCFNLTATNTYSEVDYSRQGQTSLYGMNLTTLETTYGIKADDVDGVDETFSRLGTHESGRGFNHSLFYTNNLEFSAGECLSTHLFANNGEINDVKYEEVLLYDPVAQKPVFASILNEGTVLGFDGKDHDFEMLVLENGHGVDVSTTTYYFYVELE